MTTIRVATQAELDSALMEYDREDGAIIVIDSPRDMLLSLDHSGAAGYGPQVRAAGVSTVRTSGPAVIEAGASTSILASGVATVWAYDMATVDASGSARVLAYDGVTVRASETATVDAYGSVTVRAGRYVAVRLHSRRATVTGGTLIDLTNMDLSDPQTWADYTGAEVTDDGRVVLYKAVDNTLTAGHKYRPTRYPIGMDVTAPDWRDDHRCGGGLHVSPRPRQALIYYRTATRMLRVSVPLADLRPIPGGVAKAKARTLRVEDEVTLTGEPLPAAVGVDR